MHETSIPYLWLWAKTRDAELSPDWHPLPYHLLDVAAVAEGLIENDRFLIEFAQHLDVGLATLKRIVVFLVALHDLGKACDGFQAKSERHWPRSLGDDAIEPLPLTRHAEPDHKRVSGFYLLDETAGDSLLQRIFPGERRDGRRAIAGCVAGHHGAPIDLERLDDIHISAPFKRAARALVDDIAVLLAPGDHLTGRMPDRTRAAFCWWLSALLPVADWLGSNATWFGARAPDLSLDDYWRQVARPAARKALAESTLLPAPIAPAGAKHTLSGIARLSPLQEWAASVALPEAGPVLAMIEDATGAGKTEAALLLAHRMMEKGLVSGSYMAMPTMATANAMYDRMGNTYRRFVAEGSRPSLVLAHGKSVLNSTFSRTLDAARPMGDDPDSVGMFCHAWFADDRRKALLAQFGAGTIDQALLAVLSAKYQSLRLFGLSSKVLVLDEVHAYDAYVGAEMERLISFQAMFGGSVILLSATLPLRLRQRLCDAFASGCVWRHGDQSAEGERGPALSAAAYPQATLVHGRHAEETALPLRSGTARTVRVERIDTLAQAERLAIEQARRGAAVALIRSTVAGVQETAANLRRAVQGDVPVDLFHARFMIEDRLAIENDCLRRFGKDGAPQDRRGRILVASQVIEQSLDLDMDCLITDLAPVDLLIQRAGRLWRHERRNAERPVAEAVLHVVSAPPGDDAGDKWLHPELPEPSFIYNAAILWLSARALFDAGRIETRTLEAARKPTAGHVRALVEAVYGENADLSLPEGLRDCFARKLGEDAAGRGVAKQQLLDPKESYNAFLGQFADEARIMTRPDRDSRALRLAVRRGESLLPAATVLDPDIPKRWDLSEVTVTGRIARQMAPPDAEALKHLDPPFAKFETEVLMLEMLPDPGSVRLRSACGRYAYDRLSGFEEIRPQTDSRGKDDGANSA